MMNKQLANGPVCKTHNSLCFMMYMYRSFIVIRVTCWHMHCGSRNDITVRPTLVLCLYLPRVSLLSTSTIFCNSDNDNRVIIDYEIAALFVLWVRIVIFVVTSASWADCSMKTSPCPLPFLLSQPLFAHATITSPPSFYHSLSSPMQLSLLLPLHLVKSYSYQYHLILNVFSLPILLLPLQSFNLENDFYPWCKQESVVSRPTSHLVCSRSRVSLQGDRGQRSVRRKASHTGTHTLM